MQKQPPARTVAVPPWVIHGAWALALVAAGFCLHRALRPGRRVLDLYERGYADGLAREPMASRADLTAEPGTDPE